jgi:hypothetical protein
MIIIVWIMIGVGYVCAYTFWGMSVALVWLLQHLAEGVIVTYKWSVAVAWPALVTYVRRVREH